MQRKIDLWKNDKNLEKAGETIICLTFLTTEHTVFKMIPLMIKTYKQIKKDFPEVMFYSLSFIMDKERVHFFDLRIFPPPLWLLWKLGELKKICERFELDDSKERIADIDVFTASKEAGKLKTYISRKSRLVFRML